MRCCAPPPFSRSRFPTGARIRGMGTLMDKPPDEPTDPIEQLRGDPQALAAFFQQHRDRLRRMAGPPSRSSTAPVPRTRRRSSGLAEHRTREVKTRLRESEGRGPRRRSGRRPVIRHLMAPHGKFSEPGATEVPALLGTSPGGTVTVAARRPAAGPIGHPSVRRRRVGARRRLTVNFGGVPRLPGRDPAPCGASPSISARPSTPGGRGPGPIPRAARLVATASGPGRAGVRRAVGPRPRRVSETSDPPGGAGSRHETTSVMGRPSRVAPGAL
jgi:hypothetical protein